MASVAEESLASVQPGGTRWYEKEFPEVDELVMVQVKEIASMGAYVRLLEYGNIEGMILLSELSRRRIRSINKLIRVGKNEAVMVLRVDKEKGYIDLSKRRVSPEEVAKCEEKYNKSKQTASLIRQMVKKTGLSHLELNKQITWPLSKKFKHPIEAFKLCLDNADDVFQSVECSAEVWAQLVAIIKKRMTPTAVKIRSDIEVSCFTYDGIDAIKEALAKGKSVESDEIKISIRLIAPPLYVMSCMALNKDRGIQLLTSAIEEIRGSIATKGGTLTVKEAPFVATKDTDDELEKLMSKLEEDNKEKDGDDPEEDGM